jgi:predicted nucleic acid-binding protein
VKSYLVDTNVILRFLTAEPRDQAEKTRVLFERCDSGAVSLRILPLVVAEVVFVLSGRHYGYDRKVIARELGIFLENPKLQVDDRDTLLLSLRIFAVHKIDYADAFLAAVASIDNHAIASFDQDFKKIPELELLGAEAW